MNLREEKYSRYALVREMMQAVDVASTFSPSASQAVADMARQTGRLLLAGEGSSRIFPAKNAIRRAMQWGLKEKIATDGCHQACLYNLEGYAALLSSNSGRTRETMMLAEKLWADGNRRTFAVTANPDTPLERACSQGYVLRCGWEQAVAATKSVVEQALFFESTVWHLAGKDMAAALAELPDKMRQALETEIPVEIISYARNAGTIYVAGWNDGVAEELTLKTNEIARRKSDYMEGTYILHGIEEVMRETDLVVIVDPIAEEMEKYDAVLRQGAGVKVVAIATHPTPFATIVVPEAQLQQYVFLAAGWNLLVEIGIADGIDLDKPNRARKVGNEI